MTWAPRIWQEGQRIRLTYRTLVTGKSSSASRAIETPISNLGQYCSASDG